MKLFSILFGAIATLTVSVGPAFADTRAVYTISGIQVDKTASTTQEAELNAIAAAKIIGLQALVQKLTLPEEANLYKPLVDHPRVLCVVALSGGYSREEANDRLSRNTGMIASFSRALTEGLSAQQSDDAFDGTLAATIDSIHKASVAG